MKTNIAITGASGNLGSTIVHEGLRSEYEVFAIPSELYRPWVDDIKIRDFFSENNISYLIHCASYTNVDNSESEPNFTYNSNVSITEKLSIIALSASIKMVYISSTGVYGTNSYPTEGLNNENLLINPLNHYHQSKFFAENIVKSLSKDYLIIVLARAQEMSALSKGDTYHSNKSQYGNPTSSRFVAASIFNLLSKNVSGIYNCVNDGVVSRYEFIRNIKDYCGFEFILSPEDNSFFKRQAIVPLNETADTSKIREYIKVKHWNKDLEDYCIKIKKYLGG